MSKYVVYDIPNEMIYFFDEENDELTDEDLRNNKILMGWHQAETIRKAKNLPMPCPPVKVVVRETPAIGDNMSNIEDAITEGIEKEKKIVQGAWKTLIEHVEEVINHPVDALPSSVSVPNTIDGDTMRLTLEIKRIYPKVIAGKSLLQEAVVLEQPDMTKPTKRNRPPSMA